jgi:hypothetical protein
MIHMREFVARPHHAGVSALSWLCHGYRKSGAAAVALPAPEDRWLAWFAREPWPSVSTGAELGEGDVPERETLEVFSEMNEDGVLFGDGIEDDRISFSFGRCATLRVAEERLRLVC